MRCINWELPPHILQIIFSKLPLAQFLSCRAVCKSWNSLVLDLSSSPNSHLSNTLLVSSILHVLRPDTRCSFSLHSLQHTPQGIQFSASFRPLHRPVAASCNGLLLCVDKNDSAAPAILNPMTNEYFTPPGSEGLPNKVYNYGFGFSPRTREYKIARLTQPGYFFEKTCTLDMFTIGKSTQWNRTCSIPFAIHTHGVYFNGALYWSGMNCEYELAICRFDLDDNQFQALRVWKARSMLIGLFNGGLYATVVQEDKFQVWIMRENDSWIREFVVDAPQFWPQLQLVRAYPDEKILCLAEGFYFDLYNPKTREMKRLNQEHGYGKTILEVMDCTQPLFRVHHYIDSFNFDTLQTILTAN